MLELTLDADSTSLILARQALPLFESGKLYGKNSGYRQHLTDYLRAVCFKELSLHAGSSLSPLKESSITIFEQYVL